MIGLFVVLAWLLPVLAHAAYRATHRPYFDFVSVIHLIRKEDIPDHWPRWMAVDWGSEHPVMVIVAKDQETGHIIVEKCE